MERIELVELVREKTGVGYSDAKAALDASGDDLLDALVWLEDQGLSATRTAKGTTGSPAAPGVSSEMRAAQSAYERSAETGRQAAAGMMSKLWGSARGFVARGLAAKVVSYRGGERFVTLPLLLTQVGMALWLLLALQGLQSYSRILPWFLLPFVFAAPVVALFYLLFACHIERPGEGGGDVGAPAASRPAAPSAPSAGAGAPPAPEGAARADEEEALHD